MSHDFIEMINVIEFLYGFIYESANLVNNLDDYDNYNHFSVKLCNKFMIPIINITKKEHIKEYNEHIKNIIDNLESSKDICSICSYLMNICCEEYFKLSKDEYLEIKKIIDNNIDIIEYTLAPINYYFDSYKKCSRYYYHENIIKPYFNIWYIKFFNLLQKNIELNKNIYNIKLNINVLMKIFINLYNNSGINCNKKNRNITHDLHINIIHNKYENRSYRQLFYVLKD